MVFRLTDTIFVQYRRQKGAYYGSSISFFAFFTYLYEV